MSRRFTLSVNNKASGTVADTFKTMLGIISDATTKRGRLISLEIGIADDSPQDLNFAVKVGRTNGADTGTASEAPTPVQADPDGAASVMTAGRDYSVEPTTFETEPLWLIDLNARNGYFKDFYNDEIRWRNQTLGISIAPRAAVAVQFTCTVTWEED